MTERVQRTHTQKSEPISDEDRRTGSACKSWVQQERSVGEKIVTFTFPAGTDFEEAGSQALLWADAEALIGRVLLFAGQDRTRRCEAVGGDSFHLHVFLELHVDRPAERRNIKPAVKIVLLSYYHETINWGQRHQRMNSGITLLLLLGVPLI